MAPRLLKLGLATAALTAACLWPAEYYVVPDPLNSPPVIDTYAVVPGAADEVDGRVVWDPATTPELEFEVRKVTDLDVSDTLYATWLVSYQDPVDNRSLARAWGEQEIEPNGSPQRPPISFTLTAQNANDIDLLRRDAEGRRPYVVEVLISDREPSGVALNEYPEGAQVARWRWVVVRATTGGQ